MKQLNINKHHITQSIPFLFLVISLFLAFNGSITAMYAHGFTWHFMIPPIALILVWKQVQWPVGKKIQGNAVSGIALISAAFIMLFMGKVTSTLVITELSLVVAVWGCVIFVGGFSLFSALLWPLLYLLFISSLTEGLFETFTYFFRHATATIAALMSRLFGFSILYTRTYIRLPSMILNVANECSGINHLISLVAISLPLAVLTQRRTWAVIAVMISAIPIALFSNSLRVLFLIIYNYNRNVFSHGPKNLLVTSSGFFIGLIMLYGIALLLSKIDTKHTAHHPTSGTPGVISMLMKSINTKVIFSLSGILLSGALLIAVWSINEADRPPIFSRNLSIAPWNIQSVPTLPTVDKLPATDEQTIWRFEDSLSNHLYVYIGWYAQQEQQREVNGYLWDSRFKQYGTCTLTLNDGTIYRFTLCQTTTGQNDYTYCIIYRSNGLFESGVIRLRLNLFLDALLHRSTAAAILILALPSGDMNNNLLPEYATRFMQTLIPVLEPLLD